MIKVAQVISVIGHPLFMPLYAILLILQFNPYIQLQVPNLLQPFVLGTIIVFTIVLPCITSLILKSMGVINSLYMNTTKERKWPFIFTLIWYYLGFYLLSKMGLPESLYLLMIGAISVILTAHFITLRWKISVHMIGIGGLIGAIVGISCRFQYDHINIIYLLIFFAGTIGYSRLKTNSHNSQQVYAGFVLGFLVEWLILSVLS